MAAVQCNMKFINDFSKLQRTDKLVARQVQEKLMAGLQFAAKASIYSPKDAVIDLSSTQCLLLSLIYGFYKGDLQLCLALVEISNMTIQMKSSYLKVWLRDDFDFKVEDMVEMFTGMNKMRDIGLFRLPKEISETFSVLVEKYKLVNYCHEHKNESLGRLVLSFVSDDKDDHSSIDGVETPSAAMIESFSGLSEEELQANLRKAVQNNELTEIVALINAGANIDDELDNGDTLLHLAVSNCNIGAVRVLLKYGAIPDWRNRDYITPLQMAVALNNCQIVKALVRSGAKVDQTSSKNYTLMHEAASKGNTEVLKVLVRLGASVDPVTVNGQTPLYLATEGNHLGTVEALLTLGADANFESNNGECPIHIAVSAGYSKILKCLIKSRVNLSRKNQKGMTVLHLARNKHIVKILNSGGADANIVSDAGDTPLHCAAFEGNLELAKAFIASNADINSLNSKKSTPLSVALKAEQFEMVKLLVASGANVNFKDEGDSENSLLHWAVNKEKLKCVQLLLDVGVDVNIKNVFNNTPLHCAASNGNLMIAELLINKGANVNICNHKDETPYRFAALNGHLKVAQLLLEKGAKTAFTKITADPDISKTASNEVIFHFGSSSGGNDQSLHRTSKAIQNPLQNSPNHKKKLSNQQSTDSTRCSPSHSAAPGNSTQCTPAQSPVSASSTRCQPSQSPGSVGSSFGSKTFKFYVPDLLTQKPADTQPIFSTPLAAGFGLSSVNPLRPDSLNEFELPSPGLLASKLESSTPSSGPPLLRRERIEPREKRSMRLARTMHILRDGLDSDDDFSLRQQFRNLQKWDNTEVSTSGTDWAIYKF